MIWNLSHAEPSNMRGEMIDTIVRFILLGVSAVIIIYAIYSHHKDGRLNLGLIFIATLTIILGTLFPTLQKFTFKLGNAEFSGTRYVPPEIERKEFIEFGQTGNRQAEISDEKKKLVENAKKRPDEKRSPEDYLALATEAWRAKELDKGLNYTFSGINLDPQNIEVKATLLNRLGSIFYDLNNDALASKYYRKAIDVNPKFHWPHNNLGVLYSRQFSKYKEAEEAYKEAIRLKPDFVMGYYNLGVLYFSNNKETEAEVAYKEAIRVKPDYAEAHYNLATLYFKQYKYKEAEAEYKETIRLRPDFATAYYNLGFLYSSQNKFNEGEVAYKEAIRLNPDYTEAHYYLELLLQEKKKAGK